MSKEQPISASRAQTGAGMVPAGWTLSTVESEFEVELGKMLDGVKNAGTPKPYIGNRAVQWNRIDTSELGSIRMSTSELVRYRLEIGDLLVCEGGEVGRAAIWDAPIAECYYQKALHRLRTRHGYDPRLMQALLQLWATHGDLANEVTQTSIAHLPREKLLRLPLPVPPSKEQRAIADALGDVDALLDALDRQIAKQRDLKQAAMQQLLTGRTRLPGFTGEWQRIGFAEVFRKASTKQYQIDAAEYRDSGRYSVVDQGKASVVAWSDDAARVFHPPADGVVVFGDHTCIIKLVRHDFVIGADGTQVLLAISGQCAAFHAYHLQYQGIEPTGYNRHFKFLKQRSFASPALAEQTAIAAVLSDMDAEITALETRRTKTRDLKEAMLPELLTGRTRLVPPTASTGNDTTVR